jgi:putative FmdB family regulatory protein
VPTYQYACTECGHDFEQFQSFSDDSLTVCPSCGGPLRKVFNAVGVVFKGSGFYRNDSRATTTTAEAGAGSSGNGTKEKATSGANGSSSDSGSSKTAPKTSTESSSKGSGTSDSSSKSSSGTPAATS